MTLVLSSNDNDGNWHDYYYQVSSLNKKYLARRVHVRLRRRRELQHQPRQASAVSSRRNSPSIAAGIARRRRRRRRCRRCRRLRGRRSRRSRRTRRDRRRRRHRRRRRWRCPGRQTLLLPVAPRFRRRAWSLIGPHGTYGLALRPARAYSSSSDGAMVAAATSVRI